jgi:hypothetical protein
MTTPNQTTPSPAASTRAQRMRQPLAADVVAAVANQHGVCVRPFTMEVADPDTGEMRYVPLPCGATIESVCGPCARKAKALRMAQCREGWHLTEEPTLETQEPTNQQQNVVAARADLVQRFHHALAQGRSEDADELREAIHQADDHLRHLGVRGRLPAPDPPATRARKRSTRRRHDAPDLPTRTVRKTTVGREFAGRYRPSMFVTLTCPSYGRVHQDGTPVDPGSYDYRRAARDAVHFAALVDRWWQNLRRVVGWNVQYFATVEPQKRAAPHLHTALRGSIPHEVIRQVTAATYHQVWWPPHDHLMYTGARVPVWEPTLKSFIDPETRQPLTPWEQAIEQVTQPAHVAAFGPQVHSKGILGGTDEADRHLGYLTKYLVKSVAEIVTPDTDAQHRHADRLHAELLITPCSPRCAVWLLYGIQPAGVTSRTVPGRCKSRAHRRSTLGLPGRRVLVSRKWSGKTLADHRADRMTFVYQALAAVGIDIPAQNGSRLIWRKLAPGDPHVPPRTHLILQAIAQRIAWRAEYDRALLAATGPPPTAATVSVIPDAA